MDHPNPPIAISSWALHRTLGLAFHDSPSTGPQEKTQHSEPLVDLLDLPADLSRRGYGALQLCHFHLHERGRLYCEELSGQMRENDVILHALLIDEGDLSDPASTDQDRRWIEGWLETAHDLGAQRARIIAGKQPFSPDSFARSLEGIKRLLQDSPVPIEVENWFPLLDTPEAVLMLLDALGDQVTLCLDLGNWPKPRKYIDLPKIAHRAKTCHAKLEMFDHRRVDLEDAHLCLDLLREAAFDGTYVIVNGGPGGLEWDAIAAQREVIDEFFT